MSQEEINHAEWANPENWSFGLYRSKRDTRTWVPKRIPWMGWTINMGSPAGPIWMICFVGGAFLLAIIIILASRYSRPPTPDQGDLTFILPFGKMLSWLPITL